jgi:hypothetical protein
MGAEKIFFIDPAEGFNDCFGRRLKKAGLEAFVNLAEDSVISPDSAFSDVGSGRRTAYDIYVGNRKLGSYSITIWLEETKVLKKVTYEGMVPGYIHPELNTAGIDIMLVAIYPDILKKPYQYVREDKHSEISFP